jgi:hypothetical protein
MPVAGSWNTGSSRRIRAKVSYGSVKKAVDRRS